MVWLIALAAATHAQSSWWGKDVAESLARSPSARGNWEIQLRSAPGFLRAGMAYLIADLPLSDLTLVKPSELATNVRFALDARNATEWARQVPREVFLDSVLPHAALTEPRDFMRKEFMDKYLPIARKAKSSGDAALALNKALFQDYKVVYNTLRLRTDQSSRETIAQGMATCTGLSIMLVEACRSIGVPARIAGIHTWPGKTGNHTWVEVWDNGWHFVGAAEPDSKGLDHAWFSEQAKTAKENVALHAIFAVAYRKTGTYFPLAWNPEARINAFNVTSRYTGR
jgi:transglutaminase-like putative cysteine protease